MSGKCEHPERRPASGECSEELQRKCHGEPKCENPHLQPADGKCSDELIEKCHGKEKGHPCK